MSEQDGWSGAHEVPATDERIVSAELTSLLERVVDSGLVAGAQLLVRRPGGDRLMTAGVRRLGDPAPPTTDGKFRIGSTSKTFAAAVVLQLVAEGGLGLDDPVDGHLPGLGVDRRVTVRMLLQHTSGVFNFTGEYGSDGTFTPGAVAGLGPEWVLNQDRTFRPQDLVRAAVAEPARFEPGAHWSYSNTNYVLLRLLVEHATGHPFPEELERRIIGPLGLTGTVAPETSPDIPEPHAHGYYRFQDGDGRRTVDTTRFNPSWISAAGDLISTTRDLSTFAAALMRGQLIPQALLDEMRTPHAEFGYGLGIFVEHAPNGTVVYHHNGNFWGWAAIMISSADGATVVTASLTSGDTDLDLLSMSQAFETFKRDLIAVVF